MNPVPGGRRPELSPVAAEEDRRVDESLRPDTLDEYVGQERIRDNLRVAIAAAQGRAEVLDHVLLCGPPGLGKTSLARVIAHEMGAEFRSTSGTAIERVEDLKTVLLLLERGQVLFIDEIHSLPGRVEEVLYPAMEDGVLDLIIGQGPSARSERFAVKPFTLVGATTRAGMLNAPLRDRFGATFRLEFYQPPELVQILTRSARILRVKVAPEGAQEIARRSRGTPRIANRLLRRVRDYVQVHHGNRPIDAPLASAALDLHQVDDAGLDGMDREILLALIDRFHGRPVGLKSIAAVVGDESDTIEYVYEPYLVQAGYIQRTPKGRIPTELAYAHVGRNREFGSEAQRRLL